MVKTFSLNVATAAKKFNFVYVWKIGPGVVPRLSRGSCELEKLKANEGSGLASLSARQEVVIVVD